MDNGLKPCPFCGGEAWFERYNEFGSPCEGGTESCVACKVCRIGTVVSKHPDADSVAAWNRRTEQKEVDNG